MKFIVVMIFASLSLVGCVNTAVTQLSEESNWVGLANYDVEAGNKLRSDEDLTKLGAVSVEQQKEYISAYDAHVKEYCNPQNAYKAGIFGKPRNNVCINDTPRGWMYESNWKIGLEAGDI